MKKKKLLINLLLCLSVIVPSTLSAQEITLKKDTIKTEIKTEVKESDRNVMLNASTNSTGPRTVNFGLPSGTGSTTITENGLPIVYYAWPELPTMAWRRDATINKFGMLSLGETAISNGEVGYTVITDDNLGTDKYKGVVTFNTNHHGLLRGTANISGPLNNKGTQFSVGAYVSYDPGFFDTPFSDFYNDQTQMYKAALTQNYKFNSGTGKITAFYKYMNTKGLVQSYAPFMYKAKGKVDEFNSIKIGGDNYFEQSGKTVIMDPFTGEKTERDIVSDFRTESHTFDLIGSNKFNNGLNLDYTLRYHSSKVAWAMPILTGVTDTYADTNVEYKYEDGTAYTGDYVQNAMLAYAQDVPIKNLAGIIELSKRTTNHDWKMGLTYQHYYIDDYIRGSTYYQQEVNEDPKKLYMYSGGHKVTDDYGNLMYNPSLEYNRGKEHKTALSFLDKWTVSDRVSLTYGGRLEYKKVDGKYAPSESRSGGIIDRDKLASFNHDDINLSAMANSVIKITNNFGALGEFTYNEMSPQIENYAGEHNIGPKKSRIPGAAIGVYYNHPLFSVVSKGTYISKDNYITRLQLVHPDYPGRSMDQTVKYDIQTMGWTTDIMAKPFKKFSLHFLVTIQKPAYRKYSGSVEFSATGSAPAETIDFNFKDKTVTGVSKFLLEIDPSYQWDKVRIWASARYFSKQYANLANTLYFAGRWETFGGVDYKYNKHLNFGCTVVNILNQRGAQGSISGTDLMNQEQANQKIGTVLSGTYIRPFTVEFSATYRF
ncbi:MAG: TonB-dependent receptor [Prevotella sp.]|jgi:hypothetical protein|nr:TonB-dependent receptor [Prevotella sp.]